MSANGISDNCTGTPREFHIGAILTVTTGCLLTPIGKVYEILNFMTGDNLFTHQLPRASRECAPHLIRQHPMLDHVDASGVNEHNWKDWLDAQIVKFGQTLPVSPLPEHEHEFIDPLSELAEKVHPDRIIVVKP